MKTTFGLCVVALAATICSGYIPGSEYHYNAHGTLFQELGKKLHQHAGFVGRSEIVAQIKENSVICQIKNPEYAAVNLRPDEDQEIKYATIPSVAEHLEKPYQINYKNGVFRDLIVAKDDPYWSVNIKKAVASRFQLNFNHANVVHESHTGHTNHSRFDNDHYFHAMEDGLIGECEVIYDIQDDTPNELFVTKTKNFDNCKDMNYKVYENDNAQRCYKCDTAVHTPIQLSDITDYELKGDRKNYVVERLEMHERLVYAPHGYKAEYIKSDSNMSIELADVKKAETPIVMPADVVTHTDLRYEFQNEHFEVKNAEDLKKAHNNFLDYSVKAPAETVYKMYDKLHHSDDGKPYTEAFKNRPIPFLFMNVVKMIDLMSYDDLDKMYNNHVIHGITDEKDLKDRRWLFGNLLVESGTGAAFMFIKHGITELGMKPHAAAHIIMELPSSLKDFSPVLLEEFYTLCEHPKVQEATEVRKSCYLAFSSFVYQQCVKKDHGIYRKYPILHRHECTSKTAEKYFERMVKSSEGKEKSSLDKILCIKTAGQFGTTGSLEYLRKIIHDTHLHPYYRFSAIWALTNNAEVHPKEVLNLVMPIYFNTSETHDIRNIALFFVLFSKPKMHHITAIAENLEHEPNYQVQHYTLSTLRQVAEAEHPCYRDVSAMCKKLERYFERLPHSHDRHDYRRSFTRWRDGYDFKWKLGGGSYFTYINSNDSYIPRHINLFIDSYTGLTSRVPIEIGYTGYGLDKITDHLFSFAKSKGEAVDNEMKAINDQLHIKPREHEELLGDIQISVYGREVTFFHFNDKDFENHVEQGANTLPELIESLKDMGKLSAKWFSSGVSSKFIMPSAVGWPVAITNREIEFMYYKVNSMKLGIDGSLFGDHGGNEPPPTVNVKLDAHLVFDQVHVVTASSVSEAVHLVIAAGVSDRHYHSLPLKLKLAVEPSNHKVVLKYTPIAPHTRIVRTFTPFTLLRNMNNFEGDVMKDGSLKPYNRPDELVKDEKDFFHDYLGYGLNIKGTFAKHRKLNSIGSLWKFLLETNTRDKFYYLAVNPKGTMFNYEEAITPATQDPTSEVDIILNFDHFGFETNSDKVYKPSFPTVQDGHENYINSRGDRKASTCLLKVEKSSKGSRERKLIAELAYTYTFDNLYHKIDFLYDRAPYSRKEQEHFKICSSSSILFPHIDTKKLYALETETLSPKIQVAADLHFGKNCENDRKVTLRGEMARTEEHQQMQANLKKKIEPTDEHDNYDAVLYNRCKKDNARGVHYSVVCRKFFYRALKLRHYSIDVELENFSKKDKICLNKIDNFFKLGLFYYYTDHPNKVANESNRFHVEAEFSAKTDHVDVEVRKPLENTKFEEVPHPDWIQARSAYPLFEFTNKVVKSDRAKYTPWCSIEGNHVVTFDRVKYNISDVDCYKLLAKDCSDKEIFAVLSKDVDHNVHTKALKLLLPNSKIKATPNAGGSDIAITLNDQPIAVTEEEPYFHYESVRGHDVLRFTVSFDGLLYKIKSMHDSGITVYYDGKSVVVYLSPYYRGKQCGLCGDFNGNNVDEFLGPKDCVFDKASDFVNSYTLGDKCNVPEVTGHCEPHPSFEV